MPRLKLKEPISFSRTQAMLDRLDAIAGVSTSGDQDDTVNVLRLASLIIEHARMLDEAGPESVIVILNRCLADIPEHADPQFKLAALASALTPFIVADLIAPLIDFDASLASLLLEAVDRG